MPLINTPVPNLIQGVSQQPDATRFAGQCEEQENALSSVAGGLRKRPNTRHVAKLLDTAISSDSFVHFINRSDSEKYVLIHDGQVIRAWNIITGKPATINGAGSYSYTPPAENYLYAPSPKYSLKGLTVSDNTFILNTKHSVYLNQNKTDPLDKEALVFIKQGDYGKQYKVKVDAMPTSFANHVSATAIVGLVRYTQSSWDNGGQIRPSRSANWTPMRYYTRYAWRVNSVALTSLNGAPLGGAGYYAPPNVTISSSTGVSVDPVLRANMNGSVINGTNIGSISVQNASQNSIAGLGSRSQYSRTYYGETAPTVSVIISPSTSTTSGVIELSGECLSGKAASSSTQYPRSASTENISALLATGTDRGGMAGYSATKPMDGTDADEIGSRFTVTRKNNLIVMTKRGNWDGDFTITTEDGLSNTGMQSVYKEIDSISSLPLFAKNGFKVKVKGDLDLDQDDYYVEFITNSGGEFGEGSWNECAGYDIEKGFDSASMPVSVVNNDLNAFTIEPLSFSDRTAGDEFSNPNPSFVGTTISSMFFFKNRLGFLSKDNVILGEAGIGAINNDSGIFEYNFFRKTVSSLLDDDVIDVSVSSAKIVDLTKAVGFQENLILFSSNGQFVMKGGELLTPKTVAITPVTNFDYEDSVPPLALGSFIYYPFTRGKFTGLREFTVNANTDNYDSVEITEHVPSYIPRNIVEMKGTTAEDMIVMLSDNENDTLYIYNYFWNNNQKVLSAWSKFTFTGEIRGIEFIESTLYAVIVNNGETNLVELPLESGLTDEAGFVTHLDMRCYKTVAQGGTSITLPYTPADNSVEVYTQDGLKLNSTNAGNTVTLTSPMATSPNLSVTKMVAGRQYTIVSVGTTDFRSLGIRSTTRMENNLVEGQTYQIVTEGTGFTTAGATDNLVGTVFTAGPLASTGTTGRAVNISVGTSFYATNSGTGTGVVSEPNVWVGIPYTMKYTFNEQIFKAKSGNGTSPSNAAKLLIRNGSIYFDDTAFFKVKVTPKFRDTYENIFTPDVVGSTTIGTLNLDSGFYRFPVFTKAQDTKIEIENDSALPSNFQSAEFESFLHSRSARYA